MQNIRVLMAVVLLLIPGCTYLDDVNEESSEENLRISNRFLGALTQRLKITILKHLKTMVHVNMKNLNQSQSPF